MRSFRSASTPRGRTGRLPPSRGDFYALGGRGAGVPLRATISAFGPILLSKVLGLNQVQESSLGLMFYYADGAGRPLLDLSDLIELLKYLVSGEGKSQSRCIEN